MGVAGSAGCAGNRNSTENKTTTTSEASPFGFGFPDSVTLRNLQIPPPHGTLDGSSAVDKEKAQWISSRISELTRRVGKLEQHLTTYIRDSSDFLNHIAAKVDEQAKELKRNEDEHRDVFASKINEALRLERESRTKDIERLTGAIEVLRAGQWEPLTPQTDGRSAAGLLPRNAVRKIK